MKAHTQPAARGLAAPVLPAILAACLASGLVAGCSSSDDDPNLITEGAVVQDLILDATGQTVVATIEGLDAFIDAGMVVASAGQNAMSVQIAGDEVTVTFDARVTPSHQIRFVGVNGVDGNWRDVSTTDPRTPQYGVIGATQDTSDNVLGGDTITVAFVAGPRVVESQAEDPSNWVLTVEGIPLDMTGTTISLDNATQVLQMTLGSMANLHSTFTLSANVQTVADTQLSGSPVIGNATGDTAPPSLEGGSPVVQNLDTPSSGDEYGRVIEIDFDEPISPVFGAVASNFSVVDHPNAVGTTLPTRVAVDPADNSVVRVFFNRPVVPGLDRIMIDGVVDAHGNAITALTASIAAQAPVANAYSSVTFETVEGAGNDRVLVTTTQALDPDTAALPARWTFTVGGMGAIDLSTQTLGYDLLSRTLTIDLDFDVTNGTTGDIASVGGVDVDGQDFTLAAAQVTAGGDASAPTVNSIVQNRTADSTGRTVDVTFSEDVDVVSATTTGNYTFSPAITVNGATLLGGNIARLTLASPAVPGDAQLTVAQAVSDPAGNDLGSDFGPAAIVSSDGTPPGASSISGRAVEGAGNDVITVLFDDTMVESEVEDATNWTLESPIGTAIDVTGATVAYDDATGIATMTLDGAGAPSLLRGEVMQLEFAAMRDLGGNTIGADPVTTTVTGEATRPSVEASYLVAGGPGNAIVVRFSEAMGRLTDLYDASSNPAGVRFGVVHPTTMVAAYPISAVVLDEGLGVQLTYAITLDPASTVDVVGPTDLAGNVMFPSTGVTLEAEDTSTPSLDGAPTLTAVSGTDNDVVTIVFDDPMASWGITNPDSYVLRVNGGAVIDLSEAAFEFDGVDTVTVTLSGVTPINLGAATTYDVQLVVDPTDPLRTRQGVAINSTDTELNIAVAGDVTQGPTQGGSTALLDPQNANAILVVYDETVDTTAALTAAAYDYNGGSIAQSVALVGPRVVRATFGVGVAAGNTIQITNAAAVDTAGNAAAGTISLTTVDDQVAPIVTGVTATIVEGVSRDHVEVSFDEEVDAVAARDVRNYSLTDAGGPLRVGAAVYDGSRAVTVLYVEDLTDGDTVMVSVDGVGDLSGNVPASPVASAALASGDSGAPTISSSFVNLWADPTGLVVEVELSEDVDTTFAGSAGNWSTSGTPTVVSVEVVSIDHVRLQLSAALAPTETLTLAAGLTDPAGNAAGDLVVDPID